MILSYSYVNDVVSWDHVRGNNDFFGKSVKMENNDKIIKNSSRCNRTSVSSHTTSH